MRSFWARVDAREHGDPIYPFREFVVGHLLKLATIDHEIIGARDSQIDCDRVASRPVVAGYHHRTNAGVAAARDRVLYLDPWWIYLAEEPEQGRPAEARRIRRAHRSLRL